MDEPEYIPKPIDTSQFPLDDDLAAALKKLPRIIHDSWAKKRLSEGWTLGPRDDARRTHPSLMPFERLDENEKSYDREVALQTVLGLMSMGFSITRDGEPSAALEAAGSQPHGFEQHAAQTKKRIDEVLEPIDRDAIRHRRAYRGLAMVSAVFGTLAVLLAIGQIFVAQHQSLARIFFACEALSAAIALGAAIYGLYVGTHHHWLLARFKTERLRALHATGLIHILTGTFDQSDLELRIQQISNTAPHGMNEWLRLDLVPRPEQESVRTAIHGHLDAFREAYLDARLAPQANYLSQAEQRMELSDRRSRKIPPALFFASIGCVALHAALHPFHAESAERVAHFVLLLAASLPVVAAGLRTYREAAQLSRNASRFASKAFALSMLRHQLVAATSSSQALAVAWRAEQMLEAEHREWLRLMMAAEWFG